MQIEIYVYPTYLMVFSSLMPGVGIPFYSWANLLESIPSDMEIKRVYPFEGDF